MGGILNSFRGETIIRSGEVHDPMQHEGIEVLFGLAGGPIQDIMGWAPHWGVRPIGVRHEQAATFAAAAYGY